MFTLLLRFFVRLHVNSSPSIVQLHLSLRDQSKRDTSTPCDTVTDLRGALWRSLFSAALKTLKMIK